MVKWDWEVVTFSPEKREMLLFYEERVGGGGSLDNLAVSLPPPPAATMKIIFHGSPEQRKGIRIGYIIW